MLTLLALASAGAAPAAGFNGGAFVGAQAGFVRPMLKKEAKANAITKDDADKLFDALASVLTVDILTVNNDTDEGKKTTNTDKDGNTVVYISIAKDAKADDIASAFTKAIEGLKGNSKLKIASVVLQEDPTVSAAFDAANFGANNKAIGDLAAGIKKATDTLGKKEDFSKSLVDADAETKYTSNNGYAGIHAGYLGRVNDKFLVGGLVEGNWVFGKGLTPDGGVEDKDTAARFNASLFLRAMFNLTEKFMAGADFGFAGQAFRQFKKDAAGVNTKDKEFKWFWNPAARLVLGVSLTDNILATAHFGGVFPMLKQDSLRDTAVKAKYSNFHGGVGISYAFGG